MRHRKNRKAIRGYMASEGIKRQTALARLLNLSDSTISQYLAGKKDFSPRTAMRVVAITGIPMEELYQ